MKGKFFITIGYSRCKGRLGKTHGWVMFGTACVTDERRMQAVITMLNVMGFEAPAEITPAPWRPAVENPNECEISNANGAGHWRHISNQDPESSNPSDNRPTVT